jgi:hypothetical protein
VGQEPSEFTVEPASSNAYEHAVIGAGDPAVTNPLAGPERPTPEIRAELIAFLQSDQSRLGEVYRALDEGLTAPEIAERLDVATSNFVWNIDRIAHALLDGDLPRAPTVALQTAMRFRRILKSAPLSDAARLYLTTKLEELERAANDESARVEETQRAQEQTQQAEARDEAGIYVYALPHYLRYPFDPETGRTLMKVGRSDRDVIVRFRQQARTTALPEEPVLLRIYRTDEGTRFEANFHRLLEAADHYRSVARTAGREWFVTSTRFLDEAARVMELPVTVVNEVEIADD